MTIRTRDVSGCLRLALGVILAAQIFLPPAPASAHRPDVIPPRDRREVVIPDPANLPQCPDQGPIIIPACPPGLELVIFDSPVFDEETGLFVICLEKVPFCLPEGLMPEG